MVERYLIRHGKTKLNENDIIIGRLDPPILSSSIKEIEKIAVKLKKQDFEAIYTSDLIRASQTAEIISNNLNQPIKIIKSKSLREIDYGQLSGKKKNEIKIRHPLYHNNINFVNPQGESFKQVYSRIVSFLKIILKKHERVLLVTHAGCIRAAYSFFNQEDFQKNINLKISHKDIIKCIYDGKKKKAIFLED